MKTLLLAAVASLALAPIAGAQAPSASDHADAPVATCSGAHPFAQAYKVEPASVTHLRDGYYSAVFLVGLSVNWAPPEPHTLGVSEHDGAGCDITAPDNMRLTFISEAPPAAAAPCASLGAWIRPSADPGLDTAFEKHGVKAARLRWDADPGHWNTGAPACGGGQLSYSIAVAYKAKGAR